MKYIFTFLFAFALMFTPFKETKAQHILSLFSLSNPGEDLFYNTSVGLKFEIPPYLLSRELSLSATGKHFINDNHAIEAIVNYRQFDITPTPGSIPVMPNTLDSWHWVRISGLYLIHSSFQEFRSGLDLYIGGGGYVGFLGGSYNNSGTDYNSTFTGISFSIGLDWSLEDMPINVSIDWIPSFGFTSENQKLDSSFSGFTGQQGGLSLRYVLR